MKIAITLFLNLAVFLTPVELGDPFKTPPRERNYPETAPIPASPAPARRKLLIPAKRSPSPPGYEVEASKEDITLPNFPLVSKGKNGYYFIKPPFLVIIDGDFVVGILAADGLFRGIYTPNSHNLVRVHRVTKSFSQIIDPSIYPFDLPFRPCASSVKKRLSGTS